MKQWNLQDAKARLSELVDRARMGEAQLILRRGKPAAVLVSVEAYQGEATPKRVSALDALRAPVPVELELPERHTGQMREIEF